MAVVLRKPIIIATIAVIVAVIVGVGIFMSIMLANRANAPGVTVEYTDLTATKQVSVKMSNLSYSPPNIKIKKGTTVTWTNEDSVGHNVVADEASNSGGLPTEHPVFGRGGSFTQTFKDTGTFHYHCTPHTFMKGIIEVVE